MRGVGKTSLIQRFLTGEQIDLSKKNPTIGCDLFRIDKLINREPWQINFWDMGGQARYFKLTRNYYHQMDAFMLVFDMMDEGSFESALRWLHEINELKDSPKILVGNKIDNEDNIMVSEDDLVEV